MTITLNALQKQRRDTASNWTSNNTVLLAGELGYETDTKKFKIGDGSTAWQSLDYIPIPDTNRLLTGNLTVGGNFTVNGTTTTIDTTTLTVEDKNIEIGKVSTPSDTTADGGGITLKGATDKTINWIDSTDSWTLSEHLDLATGKVFKINNTEVLSATTLGSSVVSSSLTSVGTITTGTWNATAISGSKVTPDFGSQNVVTTGTLGSNDITITGTKPKLVLNDSNNENDFHIQNDDGTFAIKDIDTDTGRLTIASNGQTTISGNLDCSAGLDVTGAITQSGSSNTSASFTSTTNGANLDLSDNDTQSRIRTVDGHLHIYGDFQNAVADSAIKFFVDGSTNEKLRIDSSGVGIGTTVGDGNKLTVLSGADGIGLYRDFTGNSTGGLYLNFGRKNSSGSLFKTAQIAGFGNDNTGTNGELAFNVLNTGSLEEAMRIHSDGIVEANNSVTSTYSSTTSITPHLRIRNKSNVNNTVGGIQLRADNNNGAAAIFNIACLNSSTNSVSTLVFQSRNSDGNFSEKMRIDNFGNLLIGTTNPTVNESNFGTVISGVGTANIFRNVDGGFNVFQTGGNAGRLQIRGDGDALNTNNSYGQISDETLKQDIVDAASQWNDIKNIRVRKFRFKNNPTGVLQIGVVAQEIETISAGLVKTDDEGVKAVKYSVLYMKAVKCLQEAIAKIETLETKVAALEAA